MESGEIEQPVSSLMHCEFEAYAERMKQIRSLATPALDEIRLPEDYSQALRFNFQRIGEMAAENRRICSLWRCSIRVWAALRWLRLRRRLFQASRRNSLMEKGRTRQ